MVKYEDLSGKKFYRLTAIERLPNPNRNSLWKCICECGKTTIAAAQMLKSGKHKSCGCWRGGASSWNYVEKTYRNGYVFIKVPNHPRAHNGRVREHIVVMEEYLGRYLLDHEQVHHINGIRDDNRIENLELWSKSQPAGTRVEDKIKWAIEILQKYNPERLKNE